MAMVSWGRRGRRADWSVEPGEIHENILKKAQGHWRIGCHPGGGSPGRKIAMGLLTRAFDPIGGRVVRGGVILMTAQIVAM